MKKRVLAIVLALMSCFAIGISVASAASPNEETVMPLSSLTMTSSLKKVSGTVSTYRAKATITAHKTETLSVFVYLYNPAGTLIGCSSNKRSGVSVSTSFDRDLTKGRYKLVVNGYGETDQQSSTRYFDIP